ncbi:hypothetical protein EK21DRAFT_93547 [Setomelanomma holmii]|uniref:Uncharacterized protein n=1 Tax=Setomelanomma holmii TaxID=210430 RepID=A0A9P4GY70_9PLEO|nr:hypothetical protein EK21DRAFT_93547 [Setomelanomma holmii]
MAKFGPISCLRLQRPQAVGKSSEDNTCTKLCRAKQHDYAERPQRDVCWWLLWYNSAKVCEWFYETRGNPMQIKSIAGVAASWLGNGCGTTPVGVTVSRSEQRDADAVLECVLALRMAASDRCCLVCFAFDSNVGCLNCKCGGARMCSLRPTVGNVNHANPICASRGYQTRHLTVDNTYWALFCCILRSSSKRCPQCNPWCMRWQG